MNNISINKLFTFLVDVDSDFNPTLSSQVDLNTYSESHGVTINCD